MRRSAEFYKSWLEEPPTTVEALEHLTQAQLQTWREAHAARASLMLVEARLLEIRRGLEMIAQSGSNEYL